ncbi:MAG: response regulator [Candidatus Kapaibacteriales bacterium]
MESWNRKNILIVDDDLFNRILFKKVLEKEYNIFLAGDFATAIELIKNNQFDLLIIDLNLSGKASGIELLRTIKTFPGYSNIPAIAVTAYVGNYSNAYCIEQGFDYYIEKPFNINRFHQLVDFALKTENFKREY